MRLNYVSVPFEPADEEETAIYASMVARRGGTEKLVAIDYTLLHAPLIASGFNAFAKAVRTQNSLPPTIRELSFTRVAAITKCWYEWDIHHPIALAEGMSAEAMAIVKKGRDAGTELENGVLTPQQLAVVRLADSMTLSLRVPGVIWNDIQSHFNQKELVELAASVAFFNTVCRFVTTLNVGERVDDS